MLLDITDLLSAGGLTKTFEVHYEKDTYSATEEYKVLDAPVFSLHMANIGVRKFTIDGVGSVTLQMQCGRCLEDVPTKVEFEIHRRVDLDATGDSQADEDVEELSYIDGYHLDVDELIYTEILINLPLKVLCSDDCKGLCFVCGTNLNKGECGCNREQLDPRMSVIQDIFKNFKEV